MATPFEIPLQPATGQKFTIALAGVTYTLVLHWCDPAAVWILDIYDAPGDFLIVGGIPLVTGTDLLKAYAWLKFGGQMVVQSDQEPDAVPTFDNLGVTSHLFFVTP